jgi:uncharacterized RDD family membrane protein YckC
LRGARVNVLRVRTPEGVTFAFPLAGPASRFLAWLFDGLVLVAAAKLLGMLAAAIAPVSQDLAAALFIVIYFVLSTGYGMAMEWLWRGQTLGKKLLQLRVMDEGGLPLTPSQVVLRNLLRAVDAMPALYLVGGVVMMLNPRAQRLGDIAAGTIVVRHRRVREPDFAQLFRGRYNSLREHPHLAARLRQQVPPALAAASVEALLRRDLLEPEARVALFGELASACRRVVPFPPETTAGMPDETYVRNVVEIVLANGVSSETRGTDNRLPVVSA